MYRDASIQPPPPDASRRVDGMTRAEACATFQPKILMLARRMAARLPDGVGVTREDLASYGAIGLLEAFDHFDETQSIKFATFAEYRVRGAMLDALRAGDTMSRRRRTLARRIQDAHNALAHRLGRDPIPEEVAGELGMDLETYWESVGKTAQVNLLSMDEREEGSDEGLSLAETRVADPEQDVLQRLVDHSARAELKRAVLTLPERSRQCVLLYYGRDMTLAEIGRVFDLTPSRISQILSDARLRLRGRLDADDAAPVQQQEAV
ncbi:MAG: FliA/WhiG family RNA polymerase sigma factor [Pseudomonadota bacterium]